MNTTLTRLKQLNPVVPDETLCRLADALNRADADGWLMLCDYFNITREAALEVANDVAQKGMNVYERIDSLLDSIGVPVLRTPEDPSSPPTRHASEEKTMSDADVPLNWRQ
jgi:hypothetical protein